MQFSLAQKAALAGIGMFVFSVLYTTAIFPTILKLQLKRKVALKKGWMMRDTWSKFPFVVNMNFYMFNVTNPDGIKEGEKPIVQEVGPFVYDKYHEKTNQEDRDEDDTISFTMRDTYFFNAEKSNGLTGDEEIIVPHYLILGIVNALLRTKPTAVPIVGKAVDIIFSKPNSIFIKAKVKDILFDGLFIDCTAKDFAGAAICSEVKAAHEEFGLKMVAEDQYLLSLWAARNGTDAKARLRVKRGLKNIMDVGKVVEYADKANISVWDDDYCDQFNGTDGTVFHPKFDRRGADDIVAFNTDLCRSVSCRFQAKSKFKGIRTLRYSADLGTDGEHNELHKCYCPEPDKCLKKGAYDLMKCIKLPLVLTNPHFYMADPSFSEQVDGMSPDPAKHQMLIDLEPLSGAPVQACTRAQFNMFIMPVPKFKLMKKFPDALLPLFWFDEQIVLPDFLLKEIRGGAVMYKMGKMFGKFMMFGGLLMIMSGGGLFVKQNYVDKANSKTTVQGSNVGNGHGNGDAEKKMNISTVQAPIPPNIS
ncbi:sensory neuron membrane protein 1-like [Trichogramma pretiosum]|uniref:sensory neuron membrane protein 1-like n=1 Tax=Trichogramma pretiosum TaxID=7493 RepID=UPI0006C9D195|nr:sensory neuron membrane protein 1-like [Trichogramma pretiosum]